MMPVQITKPYHERKQHQLQDRATIYRIRGTNFQIEMVPLERLHGDLHDEGAGNCRTLRRRKSEAEEQCEKTERERKRKETQREQWRRFR